MVDIASEFVRHMPCEECGSSDGNSLYSDGHTYCFVCHTRTGDNDVIHSQSVSKTVHLKGSAERGSRLFRINCAGCHGISAQGLVGPNIREVSHRLNDKQIINQIVKGRTPPMPSFELEPQAMADLIKHLHSIN